MISYFPEIYPDELLYSVFSRYYAHSSYMAQSFVFEELFTNNRVRPEFLFVNELNPHILQFLTKNISWIELIKKHTMFPYYSMFLAKEKREVALQSIMNMSGNYSNKLSITPNRKDKEYLKYCPMCVEDDRVKYSEAYWHRIHQIPEINVCPIHGCKLQDSIIEKNKNTARGLYPAETSLKDMDICYGTQKQVDLAKYVVFILNYDGEPNNNVSIGEYLMSQLSGTKYLSIRGEKINLSLLYSDFMTYYDGFDGLSKMWQLSKVFHNERVNPFEIAQLGFFLNISVEDLIKHELSNKRPEELFDNKVISMINKGISSYRVAKELNVSASLIRLICKENNVKSSFSDSFYNTNHIEFEKKLKEERDFWLNVMKLHPDKCYSELRDIPEYTSHLNWLRRNDKEWTDDHYPHVPRKKTKMNQLEKSDKKLLPDVKRAIKEIKELDKEKPQRISIYAINNHLGLKGRDLYSMTECVAEINKYTESQEKFWCRKAIWAAEKMIAEDIPINATRFKRLTNITRDRLNKCYPLICQSGNQAVIEIINQIH